MIDLIKLFATYRIMHLQEDYSKREFYRIKNLMTIAGGHRNFSFLDNACQLFYNHRIDFSDLINTNVSYPVQADQANKLL